jgi:hypothetical protein
LKEGETMSAEHDKFWNEVQGKLRRALDLHPLCPEESEKEYKKAKAEPVSDQDVDDVLKFVRSMGEEGGMTAGQEAEAVSDDDAPSEWQAPVTNEMMDDQVLQLNRNAGEKDQETDDLIEKHRREALGDESANKQTDESANKDEPRLEDGEDASGTGDRSR